MAVDKDVQRASKIVRPQLPWTQSYRHHLALLAFLGFFNVYALRVNLSVAVVKMAEDFNWSNAQKGLVLSAFFYGYIVTQLPGGWLATKHGGKKVFAFGVLTTSVLTLVTPVAASNLPLLVFIRVMEGLGEGVTYPAMHAMWARWAPPLERSKLATFCYSGAFLGTVVALPISGILAGSDFLQGWPSVFYVFGIVACSWFVLWMWLVADTPSSHKYITEAEREYIVSSIVSQQGRVVHVPTPWKAILTSRAVWAIMVNHFCNNWGFYTLLTCMPTYFNDVLLFNISSGGFNACFPYLAQFITTLLGGQIADMLRERKIMTTTAVRKLFNNIGYFMSITFLILAGYVYRGHAVLAVACLTASVGGNGFSMAGFNVNHLDVSPRFAGVLMGLSNGLATIPGFVGPTVAGELAPCGLCDKPVFYNNQSYHGNSYWEGPGKCPPNQTDFHVFDHAYKPCSQHDAQLQWRLVFYISAGIFFFGSMWYNVLGTGEVQPWNRVSSPDDDIDDPSKPLIPKTDGDTTIQNDVA